MPFGMGGFGALAAPGAAAGLGMLGGPLGMLGGGLLGGLLGGAGGQQQGFVPQYGQGGSLFPALQTAGLIGSSVFGNAPTPGGRAFGSLLGGLSLAPSIFQQLRGFGQQQQQNPVSTTDTGTNAQAMYRLASQPSMQMQPPMASMFAPSQSGFFGSNGIFPA